MPIQEFDNGFGSGFGRGGRAQLMLVVGSHPTYQDGDILHAWNRRRIRHVHADGICHVRHYPFNGDGLNVAGNLSDVFQQNTYQFKFERISATELRITRLSDSTFFELTSGVPYTNPWSGKDEHMNVENFIARRRVHNHHRIFGTNGAEFWYGGRTDVSWDKLTTIWQEIESQDGRLEADHLDYPVSPREMRKHLVISVDDFDDQTAGDLSAPLVNETDPDNPVTVSKRKNWIAWRDLPDAVEADVLNKQLAVDIRGIRKHVRGSYVQTRTL